MAVLYDRAACRYVYPSAYDTAIGGQPVADTFPPSGSRRAGFSASAELLVNVKALCFTNNGRTKLSSGAAVTAVIAGCAVDLWLSNRSRIVVVTAA